MTADNKPLTRAEFIRREVGKGSGFAWSVAGLVVIAVATSLACILWRAAGFALILCAILVASYVFQRLCHTLPVPDRLRERWARRRVLREKYTSYFYAGFFWVGAAMLIGALFSFWRHDSFETDHLIVPGATIALGGIASLWWLLFDKKKAEGAANKAADRMPRSAPRDFGRQ